MAKTQKTAYAPRMAALMRESLPALAKDLKLDNINQAPRLQKVVVSVGLGRGKDDKRLFEAATATLKKITGQSPVRTLARKSIASFKLRDGQPIGLKVTLRDKRMYDFVDKLIHVVLPRVRDFHGVSPRSFDRNGNFNIGFADQSIFPDLSYEDTTVAHGVQITIVTTADNPEHAKALLEKLGLPFSKEEA